MSKGIQISTGLIFKVLLFIIVGFVLFYSIGWILTTTTGFGCDMFMSLREKLGKAPILGDVLKALVPKFGCK